ncbi:unnamed protein product [Brassica oleracea]
MADLGCSLAVRSFIFLLTSVWNGLSSGLWNYTVSEITRNLVKVCYSLKMPRLNRPVTTMEKGKHSPKAIECVVREKMGR